MARRRQITPAMLRRLRKDNGWTQQDLADRLLCHSMTVSQWERGLRLPSGRRYAAILALIDETKAPVAATPS